MKKIIIALFVIFSITCHSQEKKWNVDPKYKIFYKETSFETDDYKIYIEDAVSTDAFAKIKIRIFNKTNDYLLFKPSDLVFTINGNDVQGTDKQLIIFPNDEGTKVVDIKNKGSQVEKYSIAIKNLFKVAANTPIPVTEDFHIPTAKNNFSAGNFNCNAKSAAVKTDKSLIKFVCIYEGDGIGILTPGKAVAIMPKGQENPNYNRNKGTLLEKGKQDDFIIELKELKGGGDMQTQPFKIKWNDTFKESKAEPISGAKFTLEFDSAKTSERNK